MARNKKRSAGTQKKQKRTQRGRDGRVHLTLAVDPTSGRERLDLQRPVFSETWQNRMVAAAANTAYSLLRDEKSVKAAITLGKKAMDSTSSLVDGLLSRAPPGSVACETGCDHCCHQSVGVTAPEALAIHDHLLKTRNTKQLEIIRNRVSHQREKTKNLTSRERISPDLPCPFLEQRKCSIYPVRPLSCRGMNSLDAQACADWLHHRQQQEDAPQRETPGYLFVEPIRAFHAISAGLQLALSERFGLDMRPLDLTAALDLLLRESPQKGIAQSWLAGEPALSEARGADASGEKGRSELAGIAPSLQA